jgi:hypothetical protein
VNWMIRIYCLERFYAPYEICQKRLLIRHVCPSVRMGHLSFHCMDFREVWYWVFLKKSVQKVKLSLKYDKSKGWFAWRPVHVSDHTALISSWNEMFSSKLYRQSHNTRILYSVTFSFENRAVCKIMWKNIVELDSHRWQYGALHAGYLRLQTHS